MSCEHCKMENDINTPAAQECNDQSSWFKGKKKKKSLKEAKVAHIVFWPFVGPLLVFDLCGIVSNLDPF